MSRYVSPALVRMHVLLKKPSAKNGFGDAWGRLLQGGERRGVMAMPPPPPSLSPHTTPTTPTDLMLRQRLPYTFANARTLLYECFACPSKSDLWPP
jgi:hypothetical protein